MKQRILSESSPRFYLGFADYQIRNFGYNRLAEKERVEAQNERLAAIVAEVVHKDWQENILLTSTIFVLSLVVWV